MGIFSLIKVLPISTVFIWNTTLPLSKEVRGGFMIPEVYERQSMLREDVLEANHYAVNVMKEYKLDVLDLHYYFLNHIQRRAKDGIHWDATAHRRITNLILNHLSDVWDIKTPGRIIFQNNSDIMKLPDNYEFYEDSEKKSNDLNNFPKDLVNKMDRVVNSIENLDSGEQYFNKNPKRFKSNHSFGKSTNNYITSSQTNQISTQFPVGVQNQFNYETFNQLARIQIQNHLTQIFTPILQENLIHPNLFPFQNLNQNLNLRQNNKRKHSFED